MQSVALRPREARRKSPPALRTLVLNADYRPLSTYPLSIIAAQDAVSAIWHERVAVVENWPDAFFHSPSTANRCAEDRRASALCSRFWRAEILSALDFAARPFQVLLLRRAVLIARSDL